MAIPSPEIFLHWSLSSSQNVYILPNIAYCPLYLCVLTNLLMQLLNMLSWYCSQRNSRSNYIMNLVIIHWCILSYFFLIPLFLLVSIILTIINVFAAFFFDQRIGRIDLGTFSAALRFRYSGLSESSLPLSSSISDLVSSSQSSCSLFGLSKSPFQLSQCSVSEMCSGELPSSLSAGWRSIPLIWRKFNTWVSPPGRSFED